MSFECVNTQKQSRSTLPYLLSALLILGCTFFSQSCLSDELIKAFYYNAAGQLLQVELVPRAELGRRTLLDPVNTTLTIPTLTDAVVPLITGANQPMSKFATIAVYYKTVGDTSNLLATLFKVEDLQWVHERTLAKCLPQSPGDPCFLPKSCHCSGGQCCCY